MFRHDIKLAVRNLIRQKGLTVISIVGLFIELATCLMIPLLVKDELGYDRFYKNAKRICRTNAGTLIKGTEFHDRVNPGALGAAILPAVRVRTGHMGSVIAIPKTLYHAEPGMQGQPFEYSSLHDKLHEGGTGPSLRIIWEVNSNKMNYKRQKPWTQLK